MLLLRTLYDLIPWNISSPLKMKLKPLGHSHGYNSTTALDDARSNERSSVKLHRGCSKWNL